MFGRHSRHGGRNRHGGQHGAVAAVDTLDQARAGEHLEVLAVDGEEARTKAIRLGICEGASISCVTKLPKGPVIVKAGMQEIAIGRGLAKHIHIKRDERRSSDGSL